MRRQMFNRGQNKRESLLASFLSPKFSSIYTYRSLSLYLKRRRERERERESKKKNGNKLYEMIENDVDLLFFFHSFTTNIDTYKNIE